MSNMRFAPKLFARAFSSTPAPQISRVTLVGRLADTPELHNTTNGNSLIKYSIGINKGPEDNRQTAWWKVGYFTSGETELGKRMLGLAKGTLVYVEGDIWNSKYETEGGNKGTNVTITQNRLMVIKAPQNKESTESLTETQEE